MADKAARRRTVLRAILVAELVVALVTAAGVATAYNHVNGRLTHGPEIVHPITRHEPPTPTGQLNILIMGTDTRSCIGCGIDKQTGSGGSDMTILLHVEKGRRSAYGISIPRDTLVSRPECELNGKRIPGATDVMWNEALALGGPACTVKQVETVTGIYVDDYILVDFAGFKNMVDALDGVQVCIPAPIDDTKHHIHLAAGTRLLYGKQALAYVRQRSSTPNSDLGRMRRQQAFLASMLNKVTSAGTLTRPDKVLEFANAVAGSITTNPEIASVGRLADLADSLRHANLDKIRFVTAPTADFPVGSPHWGRLALTPEAAQLWQKVKNDQPLGTFGREAISGQRPSGSKTVATSNGLCG